MYTTLQPSFKESREPGTSRCLTRVHDGWRFPEPDHRTCLSRVLERLMIISLGRLYGLLPLLCVLSKESSALETYQCGSWLGVLAWIEPHPPPSRRL